jgi:hypothetical protein
MRRKPITSADEYARQAQTAKETHDHRWAERVRVDPSIWHEILDRFPDLAWEATQNAGLPDEIAVRLARWPNAYVRQQLAHHVDLPRQAIDTLIVDICDGVRASLTSNAQLTAEQLIALIDRDHPQAAIEPYLAWDAPYFLKLRFAVDWRDHISSSLPVRHSPFEDPQRMVELLAATGYERADPINPTPEQGWVRACEELDDACVWLGYAGYTSEEMFITLAASDGWESPEAAANSPHCPPRILAALAFDWDTVVRSAAATNPATDLPTLLYLAFDDWWEPRMGARGALESRFGVRLTQRQRLPWPDPGAFPAISSADQYYALCRSADPAERMTAYFGALPDELLPDLLDPRHDHRDLLWNQSLTIERIHNLLDGTIRFTDFGPERVWKFVSFLGRPELAKVVATHPDPEVREWAVISENTTEEALLLVAIPGKDVLDWHDPEDDVADSARWRLNQNFGYKIPPQGRRGPSPRIRSAEQFNVLCRSEDPLDREKATTQKAAYPGLWREVLERAPDLAKWVAINETVGPRLLDELASWPDPEVRKWVCDHPRVWLKTLDRLAFEADPAVRRRAVYNARLSDRQLRRLQSDSDPQVAAEAARRLTARRYANCLLSDPQWWRHLGNSEID